MIRLRRMLERGRAHPVLGPILLIVLVLLLAIVFLHIAQDVAEVGAICLAVATVVGLLLLVRLHRRMSEPLVAVRGDRGPPWVSDARTPQSAIVAVSSRTLPLRR